MGRCQFSQYKMGRMAGPRDAYSVVFFEIEMLTALVE
jgi:hypothetical protein